MKQNEFFSSVRIHSCGISDCDASWRWDTGARGIPDWDLWAVFRGAGTLKTPEHAYDYVRGSCFLLSPGIRYIASPREGMAPLVINVHFGLDGDAPEKPLFVHAVADVSYLYETLTRVLRLYGANRTDDAELFFRCALTELLEQESAARSAVPARIRTLVERVARDVQAHPESAETLAVLAVKAGYCRDYMGRMFAQVVGVGYPEYVISARLNRARLLLRSTDLPLGEIAEGLGYCDASAFSRQFTSRLGLTPTEYRRGQPFSGKMK